MKILNEISDIKGKCVLYGAGTIGRSFCDLLVSQGIEVMYFVDSFSKGEVLNLKIHKPEKRFLFGDFQIIITSTHWDEISTYLNELNVDFKILSNKLFFLSTRLESMSSWGKVKNRNFRFHKTKKLFNEEEKNKFKLINDLYFDNNDLNFFEYLKTKKNKDSPSFNFSNNPTTIIDVGGCIYNRLDANENHLIYLFDPLVSESSYVDLKSSNVKIITEKIPLSDKKKELIFYYDDDNPHQTNTSKIKGECKILNKSSISLDEYVKENHIKTIDLIAVDTEGMELEVLEGSKKTIKKHKPILYISVYHKNSDIFEIPDLINSFSENYFFEIYFETLTFIGITLVCTPIE